MVHPFHHARLREILGIGEPAPLAHRKIVLYLSRNPGSGSAAGSRQVRREGADPKTGDRPPRGGDHPDPDRNAPRGLPPAQGTPAAHPPAPLPAPPPDLVVTLGPMLRSTSIRRRCWARFEFRVQNGFNHEYLDIRTCTCAPQVDNEEAVLEAIYGVLEERGRGERLVIFSPSNFPHVQDLARFMAANVSALVGPHGGAWYNSWWVGRDTLLLEVRAKIAWLGRLPLGWLHADLRAACAHLLHVPSPAAAAAAAAAFLQPLSSQVSCLKCVPLTSPFLLSFPSTQFMPMGRFAAMIWEEGSLAGGRYWVLPAVSKGASHNMDIDPGQVASVLRDQLGVERAPSVREPLPYYQWDIPAGAQRAADVREAIVGARL